MNRSEKTYIKREIKKVFPVLVIGILYMGFILASMFIRLRDICLDGYLMFSEPNHFQMQNSGAVFIEAWESCMGDLPVYFTIFMEALLIRRIFYQEKRAGVSDFLRILPIKEWKKTWIKAGVGETVIFLFCFLYGLMACAVNSVYDHRLNEINSMIPGASAEGNTYLVIWQTMLLMFAGMSVIFFILFAAQMYLHNMVMGYMVGTGILIAPIYFTDIYGLLYQTARGVGTWTIPASIIDPFPKVDMYSVGNMGMQKCVAVWNGYFQKILFLFLFLVLAVAVILLALRLRWNVWESNNAVVNSKVVMEFIFAGISLGLGTIVAMKFGDLMTGTIYRGSEEFWFWLYSLIAAGIILIVLNIVVSQWERMRKKRDRR